MISTIVHPSDASGAAGGLRSLAMRLIRYYPALVRVAAGDADAFELAKQLATNTQDDAVQLLRQFESSRCDFRSERLRQRVNRVFTTSRQVGQLGQIEHPIACFVRN